MTILIQTIKSENTFSLEKQTIKCWKTNQNRFLGVEWKNPNSISVSKPSKHHSTNPPKSYHNKSIVLRENPIHN